MKNWPAQLQLPSGFWARRQFSSVTVAAMYGVTIASIKLVHMVYVMMPMVEI